MDAYRGYHQIAMDPADMEKIAFIFPRGIYCYRVMPFGLKNVEATYQRMVSLMFDGQIGNTMEGYIDDMVVKSKFETSHLQYLAEVFEILKSHKLRLNAKKREFRVKFSKFLEHHVIKRGIEANLTQINAVEQLKSPTIIREVRKLIGMVAALNKFISRSSDKCHHFFRMLKGSRQQFQWPLSLSRCVRIDNKLSSYPTIRISREANLFLKQNLAPGTDNVSPFGET